MALQDVITFPHVGMSVAAAPTSGDRDTQMVGQNIVCFAKDWDESPTSNNHVMRRLAKDNRVLWLNSVGTRNPNLRSKRDLLKLFNKLARFLRGPARVSRSMWVYTPIVLPFPRSSLAVWINRWLLRVTIRVLRRRLGFIGPFQVWVFIPTAAPYVWNLGASMLVYYVTDEYGQFYGVDSRRSAEYDRQLTKGADVVFATARSLVDRRRPLNTEIHPAPHGVDHALFATALDDTTQVPADLAALPKPVIGYYGAIREWLDLELLDHLAGRHPEWSVALIGPVLCDVSALRQRPNVHFLGQKAHADLPAYCKGLSAALIPHRINELTINMNPIKLREYLSAGLPVVSVPIPEVEAYSQYCSIAKSVDEFEAAVQRALAEDSPTARRQRSDAMRGETWDWRVANIAAQVMRVQAMRDAQLARSQSRGSEILARL